MKQGKKYLLIFFGLLAGYSKSFAQTTENLEYKILNELAEDRSKMATRFFKTVSDINNPVSIAVPASVWLTGMITHDNDLKKKALYLTESFAVSTAVTWAMKVSINRSRPFVNNSSLVPEVYIRHYSFPSGHTSEAFATATSLSLAFPKWYVIAPAYTFATLVGYSRMYLGVHYPSDVITGALVGSGSAWLMYRLNKWMHNEKNKTRKTTY